MGAKKINNEIKARIITGIYVRVSTEEQAQEGFSIRAQMEKLRSYALLKEWELYGIYSDEGISGKNIVDRPEMNRLIEDIKSGKINNVLVFKVDRLTRSTRNLVELIDLFEEHKCTFNSLTESIDTDTPSGRMFLKIIGIFAEFERENITERSRLGRERKVKEGYTLANYSMSYGYSKEKGQRVQEVDFEEAVIVREIFTKYVKENMSASGIAKMLNGRNIKTKRNAIAWDPTTVKLILTNPTYIGKVRYQVNDDKYFEVDGQHEKIIPDELFYLAEEKINNMPQLTRTKQPRENNYFCGILTCGMCGSKFTTHNHPIREDENGVKQYKSSYRCNKKVKYTYPDVVRCKCPDISHIKLEQAFTEYIKNIKDFKESDIDMEGENAESTLLEYLVTLENKTDSLIVRKKYLMEQYVTEKISFDDYKDMLDIVNDKYVLLEEELQKVKTAMPLSKNNSPALQEEIIINIKENWEHLINKEKMMFLQRFIKRIVIFVEKEKQYSVAKIREIEFNQSSINNKSASAKPKEDIKKLSL